MVDQDTSGAVNRKTYVLCGATGGIGAPAAAHLAAQGHRILSVSRSQPPVGEWVQADLATDEGLDRVSAAVGSDPIDGFLYLGGTWEEDAFTPAFRFAASDRAETRQVIAVNLTAPILLAQALAANLARSDNPRIVLLGALSGLDNLAGVEVANTASKFGLRGVAQALGIALADQGIGVTVINPGNVATPEVEDDIAAGRFTDQIPIPMMDLLRTLDLVLTLSAHSIPTEINLMQSQPGE